MVKKKKDSKNSGNDPLDEKNSGENKKPKTECLKEAHDEQAEPNTSQTPNLLDPNSFDLENDQNQTTETEDVDMAEIKGEINANQPGVTEDNEVRDKKESRTSPSQGQHGDASTKSQPLPAVVNEAEMNFETPIEFEQVSEKSLEKPTPSTSKSPKLKPPKGQREHELGVETRNTIEDSTMTATVYLAAPLLENHTLAVTGENALLGKWKTPKGSFKEISKISNDIYIFEGLVPIPSQPGTPFKFVQVDSNGKISYEGQGHHDNRNDELLPGSINFFIFKIKPNKSFIGKFVDGVSKFFLLSEGGAEKITAEFYHITFNHVLKHLMADWDSALEFVQESMEKIRQTVKGNKNNDGFRIFLNQQILHRETKITCDELFILITGVLQIGVYSQNLKDLLNNKSRDFSLYLHEFRNFKRRKSDFQLLLGKLAQEAGPNFWWILFRLDNTEERLKSFGRNKMSETILKTLQVIPQVLLDDPRVASKVMDYLVKCNDVDGLYANFLPVFDENANYQPLLEELLLEKLLLHKTDYGECKALLNSDFLKKEITSCLPNDSTNQRLSTKNTLLEELICGVFNQKLSNIVRLASSTPDYLLPTIVRIVESGVKAKLLATTNLSREDYRYFAQLEDRLLDPFPETKKGIHEKLMTTTREHMKSGSFQSIPSEKLILLALSERTDIPFLDRPKIVDLKKSINRLPTKFFHNLYAALKKPTISLEKSLKPHRKGETKNVVERLENHFDHLGDILNKAKSLQVPLLEIANLQDPQVWDCLQYIGLEKSWQTKLIQSIEILHKRHHQFGAIYSKFASVAADTATEVSDNVDLEDDEQLGDEDSDSPQVIQVFDPKEWEGYLKDIDEERSMLTLQDALDLPLLLELKAIKWLLEVKSSDLFFERIWRPNAEAAPQCPLCKEDLKDFVNACGDGWIRLAFTVGEGTVPLKEMEEIIRLQTDPAVLARRHLTSFSVDRVPVAYRDFKNLQELRNTIGPFVAALQSFDIKDRKPIEKLNNFVKNKLVKNWDTTTLSQVIETGVMEMLNEDLGINPDRPESRDALKFISSLVTDGENSPLIDWLRKKTEKDMESMGKILQGPLLEAYGQLQTLRTRIAPILRIRFKNYSELLRSVRISEEHFAQRSGRVQEIKCKWLVSMLPEIEAAIRASVISPSEDAKEKLAKLQRVTIEPHDDTFVIKGVLEPQGSLTIDEIKQAFQLLDMSVMDDNRDGHVEDLLDRTRRYVGLIEQLSDIFALVFASGCITYTFTQRMVIELDDLKPRIEQMRDELDQWNTQWKEIEELHVLALFSRPYLLQLVDLIGCHKLEHALSILKCVLPFSPLTLESLKRLSLQTGIRADRESWFSTNQVFDILRQLNAILEGVFRYQPAQVQVPMFLKSYGLTLRSHFLDKAVVILNVSKELLVGSSLAAYISITHRPVEPSRILFITANTNKEEIERFLSLWSVAKNWDFFIMVHVERLTAAGSTAVRQCVDRVLPEHRVKLLLLAQHNHRVQSTKSLGARLGLVSDRLLDVSFTTEQLRNCFTSVLPSAANLHFFTSQLSGCGKSQQAMQVASNLVPVPDYYRIPVRSGTVEELLTSLKNMENLSTQSRKRAAFLHFDVAHSVSDEFNDILLSLLIRGALYDPKKAKLGFWMISRDTHIAIEFASPFGSKEFPIIEYLGLHHLCQCDHTFFTYDLTEIPQTLGQTVTVNRSNALIAAGKFLRLKRAGVEGLNEWDNLCTTPELMMIDPLQEEETYRLLVDAFQNAENRNAPTFSALNAMATFIYRHVRAMVTSMWFSESAVYLFENEGLARVFKLNVFNMLLKVANDSIGRCWSMASKGTKLTEMDWLNRQRAMFLLGFSEDGFVTGINIVGRDAEALKSMFHPSLVPILQQQCLQFQELRGFKNLMGTQNGADVIINALRSLLLLDGTATSAVKVHQLDSHHRSVSVAHRLQQLTGQEHGYVLTGDNITKMMFALYRIRCGLPVIAFGEAGVGKSALFRYLIQTLLGHTFEVCNVNSGTTLLDVEKMIESAVHLLCQNPNSQVFLFFDEMNTADPPVIAFLKELMFDRHCHGTLLPNNLHLMAAANPYRFKQAADKEATVGLAFRFSQPDREVNRGRQGDDRNLVYRVNEIPLSFYDHIYDFGYLCVEAEDAYIDEICQHGLPATTHNPRLVEWFAKLIRCSHKVARALSTDPDSAVSLRDATRAVQIFDWFSTTPAGRKIAPGNQEAADLTIYLVYAFRFRKRKTFLKNVFGANQTASGNMTTVSRKIAKMLYEQAHQASIGSGAIALNDALCENLFALYVCVLNGIFLIIVGRPGSSKSLSVEILKLVLSPGNHTLRTYLGDLPSITELYFQCSPLSTSSGFKALFDSAQRLSIDPKTMLAMVVLDELGLADMSPEKPIKILHSELERKSVLTSGEQLSHYSVVALSNWVVDAAQVNRGILITRTEANQDDLLKSALQLAESLVNRYVQQSEIYRVQRMLTDSLQSIVSTYQALDQQTDIGGGHFFSMRDFFFCVKNFVCSIFNSVEVRRLGQIRDARISQYFLIQSAIRNFGGHEKAQNFVRTNMADHLELDEIAIPTMSPVELIVENIRDSSKELSIHIARHLMILNRSLIGLQLLNRYIRNQLDDGISWNVLFGSCFPGDLQVTAVTRKLRQVEQAIRKGGVLILCHADQLFESLYMVLNQQYWAQGDVTMTQIALGPSIRAIALPDGPFRIIALQDTDVALNRELMSPAILSRFEKHELRPSHLLDDAGRTWLKTIESHPVWLTVTDSIQRQKLLYGYHEETFASLALSLQERRGVNVEGKNHRMNAAHAALMRAVNPMAMIKLERDPTSHFELLDICQNYRRGFILEGINDTLNTIPSNRMIIMTNTLRHFEIKTTDPHRCFIIQLFDIQTELELFRMLESINEKDLADPNFCIIIQYDAAAGPIEQFQLTKYEVEQRFEKDKCRIIFVVHVDPRPVNMHWVFSFGDGWEYVFVDEVVPGGSSDQHQIPLGQLVLSPEGQTFSAFIDQFPLESFKSFLLEMLGPVLQTSLTSLRSNLGQFFTGVRSALGLQEDTKLIGLLKECLLAQLSEAGIKWNVLDAVKDSNFDSSSSLTEGLWNVFKHKLSSPLANLLLVSDVWRVCDQSSAQLWCEFVSANYPTRLMSLHTANSIVQLPNGFQCCVKPFGRLLASLDLSFSQHSDSRFYGPLKWLLNFLAKNEKKDAQEMREAYFLDWFVLRVPPHLHHCIRGIPLSKMSYLVDSIFEETSMFVLEWEDSQAEVIAALELVSIASFAKLDADIENEKNLWDDLSGRMRNWKIFTESLARLAIEMLTSPTVLNKPQKLIQSVSSIEASLSLTSLLDRVEDLQQLWLGLRITKRVLIFDTKSQIRFPELQVSSPQRLFERFTEVVVASIVHPRVASGARSRKNRPVRQNDLLAILKSTSACSSTKELERILRECPTTHSIVLLEDNSIEDDEDDIGRCTSCKEPLKSAVRMEGNQEGGAEHHFVEHLKVLDEGFLDSLFQDYQRFMFFFECVSEIYIQQRRNNPHDIREFLHYLLDTQSRLRVSWRFLTVIIRSVLSTRGGVNIINGLLLNVRPNRLNDAKDANAFNFMRALLATADQDVQEDLNECQEIFNQDLNAAAMVDNWTVERIRRLASVRHHLTTDQPDVPVNAITRWATWADSQGDESINDSLLWFILRFSTREGDQTRLDALFRNRRVADALGNHPIINGYIKNLSPLSLGFDLKSAHRRAIPFQDRLLAKLPINQNPYEHFHLLQACQPEWAPFIARLAYHAADVFETKQFSLLSRMANRLADAAGYLLPGIGNHPSLPNFILEADRWYRCDCGFLNSVGNCGRPTTASVCLACHRALAVSNHTPRAGVRQAVLQDFAPPVGLHFTRTPSNSPTFAVRNATPAVTRLALLLNCLALLNAALDSRTDRRSMTSLLLTLEVGERRQNEDRATLVQLLSDHVMKHMDILCQLLVTFRPQPATTNQFRVCHLILHQLLGCPFQALMIREMEFAAGPQAREAFESSLSMFLGQPIDYGLELELLDGQKDNATKTFSQLLQDNARLYWPYTRLVFSNRQTVQLELARNTQLRQKLPFLNFVLDEDNWTRKLDALEHLGEAIRFIALVRTVLQGEITKEEANRLTIRQGLDKISEVVSKKAVIIDRGRPVSSVQHVTQLFDGFKQLWDRFSQLLNNGKQTFLDYFECQQVDINVRPKTVLELSAPLILICAGSELPETTFSCQLLAHAVEAASSVSLTSFIHSYCRAGSGRVRISCSSAAALSDLDESLYAHVSCEKVDAFIKDHVIDGSTLQLAESFAMAAVLGPAGSTIAEDLSLDVVPDFIFKDDMESTNFLVNLDRRSLVWQPSDISPPLLELILVDLEKNRSLAEAKAVLISAITHLQLNTEPLIISQVRNNFMSDVLEELRKSEVITERHLSTATLAAFNRHLKLEVRHAFSLLKAVMCRMKGDDIFAGRIPDGWNAMMPEKLVRLTNKTLRENANADGIAETLLQLINIIASQPNVSDDLKPDKSLLYAIRQIEGDEWNGVPDEIKMEHIGHVLLITEAITKK